MSTNLILWIDLFLPPSAQAGLPRHPRQMVLQSGCIWAWLGLLHICFKWLTGDISLFNGSVITQSLQQKQLFF